MDAKVWHSGDSHAAVRFGWQGGAPPGWRVTRAHAPRSSDTIPGCYPAKLNLAVMGVGL